MQNSNCTAATFLLRGIGGSAITAALSANGAGKRPSTSMLDVFAEDAADDDRLADEGQQLAGLILWDSFLHPLRVVASVHPALLFRGSIQDLTGYYLCLAWLQNNKKTWTSLLRRSVVHTISRSLCTIVDQDMFHSIRMTQVCDDRGNDGDSALVDGVYGETHIPPFLCDS